MEKKEGMIKYICDCGNWLKIQIAGGINTFRMEAHYCSYDGRMMNSRFIPAGEEEDEG